MYLESVLNMIFGFSLQNTGFHKRERTFFVPRPNPTIVSYNATLVKIYNTTGSLARFEKKILF
jgi:hypothetical protein